MTAERRRIRLCWCCLAAALLTGCTSVWEEHQQLLVKAETASNYGGAAAQMHWLIDNAFIEAPAEQRTDAANARRQLHLAKLAAHAGDAATAVQALRDALQADPHQAAAVRAQLATLPVDAAEGRRLESEFAWNIAALAPANDTVSGSARDQTQCWAYSVHEIRIRRDSTESGVQGREHRITYDARAWRFDPAADTWQPDGAWIADAGSEVEPADDADAGARYHAIRAADGGFYADQGVPPCHRAGWQGPLDPAGELFVAKKLPVTSATTAAPPR